MINRHVIYRSEYYFQGILKTMQKIALMQTRIKSLTTSLPNKGGRFKGTIITPRRGAYKRRLYRYIDFKRIRFKDAKLIVLQFIYDPNRSAI